MSNDPKSGHFKKVLEVRNLMSSYKKNCLNLNQDEIKRFRVKRDPNEWVTYGMTYGV